MSKTFVQRFEDTLQANNSILCIGLDPALPEQRKMNVLPAKYLRMKDENGARLNFCLDILDQTADFCVAAKPNEQYLRGFTTKDHKKLTDSIRRHGLLSIYDCKLGDIRDTAESALFYYQKWGYDAITFNPYPGNILEVVETAHSYDRPIGIIVLTLMSNPEAETFMKNAVIAKVPLYVKVASDVKHYGADGCVVGATGHVTEREIKIIRRKAGSDKVFLVPGIGAQKGDPEKVIRAGGRNILINVGRDIMYSGNPRKKSEDYCRFFSRIWKSVRARD